MIGRMVVGIPSPGMANHPWKGRGHIKLTI